MSVTITPAPDGRIGPWIPFAITTDTVGPYPSDEQWEISVYSDTDFTNLLWAETHPYFGFAPDHYLWFRDTSFFTQTTVGLMPAAGENVYVRANLVRGSTADIDDTGTLTATWDPTTAIGFEVKANVSTGGGLTEEQAIALADDHAAVNPPLIAQDGTPITGGVGDVIVRPALKFIGIDTTTYELTGSGTLEVPNIAGVQTAWGIVLDVVEAPPGASIKYGYVDSYLPRVGQFLLLWPAKNTEEAMVIDELRLHLAHRTWLWDWANVIAVAYWIEPMFTVNLRFASAFFP